VFFETDEDMSNGSAIEFTVEFDGPAGKMVMRCSGEVVRVERGGQKIGVAARITESKLELKNDSLIREEEKLQSGSASRFAWSK
jgi:hypothetical protein